MQWMYKCGLLACGCALLCCLLVAGAGFYEEDVAADVAVVLGNQVFSDGTPSSRLAARLDRAVELYEKKLVPVIIVSGGVGASGVDEAEAMAMYLQKKGIPEVALVLDHNGVNTWETARFTAEYLRSNKKTNAIAVSQYFHLPRCRLAFFRQGIATSAAYARYAEWGDIFSVPREVAGLVYYFLVHHRP